MLNKIVINIVLSGQKRSDFSFEVQIKFDFDFLAGTHLPIIDSKAVFSLNFCSPFLVCFSSKIINLKVSVRSVRTGNF